MLKEIDDADKATETENTEKVEDITSENVTPEDKGDLEKAKDDLEKALDEHGNNMTEDEKKAVELEAKLRNDEFTLEDFLDQFEQMKNMGSMQDIMGMIPGMDASKLGNIEIDEKQVARTQAIIKSMTPKERRKPDILNASRRRRIARGSGTTIQEVNRLINQFEATRKMMRQFTGKGKKGGKKGKRRFPFGF